MFRGTTIVSIRQKGLVAMGGDGQVTLGDSVFKGNACKIRKLYDGQVIAGFAGGTADAFTLFERFEVQLEKHQGNLVRAAVELAREWRSDKALRQLDALLAIADIKTSLIVSGCGDVIEPEEGILAMGSGGDFAKAAALSMVRNTKLDAAQIVKRALKIAAEICVYTNDHITVEILSESKS